jgi:putative membrane protein
MSTNEEPHARFEVHVTADSHFGWIRTRLALERTILAWLRTGVSLIGFGFTIVQFFQRLNGTEGVAPALRPQAPRQLGLALIGCGILALIVSLVQYRKTVHYLWSDPFRPIAGLGGTDHMRPVVSQTPSMAVIVAVIVIGVFAFGAVLLRVV